MSKSTLTFITKKHKYIFLHIPKAAGVSIETSMYKAGIINDLEWGNIKSLNYFLSKMRKRMPLISGKPQWGIQTLRVLEYIKSGHLSYLDIVPHIPDLSSYKIYAIARDPVEACISRFNFINSKGNSHQALNLKKSRYNSFTSFVDNLELIKSRSQVSYVFNAAGSIPENTQVFKMNNISEFMKAFEKEHGIKLNIQHRNKGRLEQFTPSKENIEKIKRIYKYDYEKIFLS